MNSKSWSRTSHDSSVIKGYTDWKNEMLCNVSVKYLLGFGFLFCKNTMRGNMVIHIYNGKNESSIKVNGLSFDGKEIKVYFNGIFQTITNDNWDTIGFNFDKNHFTYHNLKNNKITGNNIYDSQPTTVDFEGFYGVLTDVFEREG